MSLTSQLKNHNSAARQLIDRRFPILDALRKEHPLHLGIRNMLGVPIMPGASIRESPVPPRSRPLVGTAFDYRIRYYFEVTPFRRLVAAIGVTKAARFAEGVSSTDEDGEMFTRLARLAVNGSTPLLPDAIASAFPSLTAIQAFVTAHDELLQRAQPVGRHLDAATEQLLDRHCAVLALFEQCWRAPLDQTMPVVAALQAPGCTSDTFLNLVYDSVVDDLYALSQDFYDDAQHLFGIPATLNPTFDGSADIGGADADLIVDDCLFEIKTVSEFKLSDFRNWLYQLLGYALLDYSDRYGIRHIGIWLPRQRQAWTAPIGLFVEPLATAFSGPLNEAHVLECLNQLRAEFAALLQRSNQESSEGTLDTCVLLQLEIQRIARQIGVSEDALFAEAERVARLWGLPSVDAALLEVLADIEAHGLPKH